MQENVDIDYGGVVPVTRRLKRPPFPESLEEGELRCEKDAGVHR
jgi:hypothetical protein